MEWGGVRWDGVEWGGVEWGGCEFIYILSRRKHMNHTKMYK